ncbi:transmembrane protein 45A-like [Chenopodium quinoa]|uniref:transmembrane protein 45A-like n=1 Tax=Chenopodium quinoa TaxID=63459 RepID=UPI000B775A86|nr:transmembrane protein 45A-like [Chenopodium quinoa]
MGTLIGHVLPGFGFFAIGLWHLFNNLRLLALKGPYKYKSLPWFPSNFRHVRHLELYLIMIGCFSSVAMELFIGPNRHQPFDTDGTIPSNHLHNFEHSSISLTFFVYAFFALALDKWGGPSLPAQHEVLQFLAALAFGQQLLLFHLHSADHMGVEGQYHWLLQLVIFISLSTTILGIAYQESFVIAFTRSLSILYQGVWLMVMGFALWTPSLISKGCFMHIEEGHQVVRCDGKESLHRAKALVNIQFSWFLILLAVFAASFYVFMMKIYGDNMEYSPMALSDQEEEDVEAQKIGGNFTETHSFVSGTGNSNNKAIDHMEM